MARAHVDVTRREDGTIRIDDGTIRIDADPGRRGRRFRGSG